MPPLTVVSSPSSPPSNILNRAPSANHTLREIEPEAGNGVHYPIGIPTGVCTPFVVRISARDRDDDDFSASLVPHPVAAGYYVDDGRTSGIAISRGE